jgi:hypothetical protein
MATKKETTVDIPEMNIYQKLLLVRDEFAQAEIKRSGKNMQLSSLFYELADIVPTSRVLFTKYRLLPLTVVTSGKATMTIVDVDAPENTLVFELDVQTYDGNKAVTPPQAYGAVVTYYRRYLYMVALDIVEADYLDNNLNPPEVTTPVTPEVAPKPAPVNNAPATPSLTDGSGNASELQITALKDNLKKLLEADPSQEEFVAQVAIATQSFTVISKADCEALIVKITEMLGKENA